MVYSGKRGMAFENTLEYTNKIYAQKGRALITKRPTPMKIIKNLPRSGNFVCVFDKKSTVDYEGVYNGIPIQFEAKSVDLERFPLDKITPGQVEWLAAASEHGAFCFVMLEMRPIKRTFLIPNEMLQSYVAASKTGGRKSIPLVDLEENAYEVKSGNGVPFDYLTIVDSIVGGF